MKFNYITNFELNSIKKEFINTVLKKEAFYINDYNIIESKEFPKNEFKNDSKSYNKLWKESQWKDKDRIYYGEMIKLCKKYGTFNNILEVGAGFGWFSKIFIKYNNPECYSIYETSTVAFDKMKKKFVNLPNNINIYNKSFKNIPSEELVKYDCVIALEVLEHINWDKEFLSSISTETWIFFSVPRIHSFNHVRAFLTPDSIAYRYKDILDIYEIREIIKYREKKYKPSHYYPTHWGVAAKVKMEKSH